MIWLFETLAATTMIGCYALTQQNAGGPEPLRKPIALSTGLIGVGVGFCAWHWRGTPAPWPLWLLIAALDVYVWLIVRRLHVLYEALPFDQLRDAEFRLQVGSQRCPGCRHPSGDDQDDPPPPPA